MGKKRIPFLDEPFNKTQWGLIYFSWASIAAHYLITSNGNYGAAIGSAIGVIIFGFIFSYLFSFLCRFALVNLCGNTREENQNNLIVGIYLCSAIGLHFGLDIGLILGFFLIPYSLTYLITFIVQLFIRIFSKKWVYLPNFFIMVFILFFWLSFNSMKRTYYKFRAIDPGKYQYSVR